MDASHPATARREDENDNNIKDMRKKPTDSLPQIHLDQTQPEPQIEIVGSNRACPLLGTSERPHATRRVTDAVLTVS